MKILFNTNYVSAATFIGMDQMIPMWEKEGHEVKRNDWENYQKYDVVFFMSPDSRVIDAKKKNPKILTCIIDPKTVSFIDRIKHKSLWKQPIMKEIQMADFLLVSSIEHRDYMLKYNKNPFIYYFFPQIPKEKKRHIAKEKIVIGYHGNKVHLDSMADVSRALDELSEKYEIELKAIYNMEKLGKWTTNRPKKCKVADIQWTPNMSEELNKCDIGISPSMDSSIAGSDYLFKFKYSNGPGRIYPFAMLRIPVVADASPSQCQFIQNEVSGFICCTKEAWYENLNKLIQSADLRAKQGENLYNFFEDNCSIEENFRKLIEFIKNFPTYMDDK